ncbi:UNVERIFIED_CONTAM: hypothetical protein FKN15_031017 [Acipenser sinensis]
MNNLTSKHVQHFKTDRCLSPAVVWIAVFIPEDTVVRLQKDRTRMHKAIGRNNEATIRVKAELSHVVMKHSATKENLEDMEQQIFTDEAKMRSVKNLKTTLLERDMKLTQTEEMFCENKITAQRQLRNVKEQNAEVSNELNHVLMRTEDLRKKTENVKASKIAMQKVAKATEDAAAELQIDFQAVELKSQNAVSSINNLQTEIANCKKRFELSEETHSTLFEIRQNFMAENEGILIFNVFIVCQSKNYMKHVLQLCCKTPAKKNLALALEYRALQKTFLEIKSRLVCSYDEKVRKGASLQDHQQVSCVNATSLPPYAHKMVF